MGVWGLWAEFEAAVEEEGEGEGEGEGWFD